MKYSENLHLALPEGDDVLEVSKLSENFETLDSAIADAGSEVSAKAFKVGDILATYRKDLGDDWLLCNGESFDPSEYPKLAEVCPGLETMPELAKRSVILTHSVTQYATDGVHQVLFMNTAQYTFGPAVSTDNFATDYTTPHSVIGGLGIFYVNNKWIMLVGSGSNTRVSKVHVADELDGPWEEYSFAVSPGIENPQHLEFFNGKYYIFGLDQTNKKPIVASFSDFTFTDVYSFVPKMLPATLARSGWNFVRTDSEFIYLSLVGGSASSVACVHTENPEVWGQENTFAESPRYYGTRAYYCDGKIMFFVTGTSNSDELGRQTYLEYVDNFESPAHIKRIESNLLSLSTLYLLGKIRGQFLVGSTYNLLVVQGLEDDDQVIDIGRIGDFIDVNRDTKTELSFWMYGNYLSFVVIYSTQHYVMSIPAYAVPSISTPQSYTYIKAKEGDAGNDNQQTDAPAP